MNTDVFLGRLKSFIASEALFEPEQLVILAVSGGRDSMLLAWAFSELGYNFQIAHCNFQLRGKESTLDEELVRKAAHNYGVKFHLKHFNTADFAKTNHISTQMAARELRYAWFEEIRMQEQNAMIGLAQHAGDLSETMLINLIRGTGIAGMHGILARRYFLIRPILFLNRDEINFLITANTIQYREDASNHSTNYLRNKIRMNVMPVLREINPSIEQTFIENALRMASVERIYQQQISIIKSKLLQDLPDGSIKISIEQLVLLKADARFVLYEILKVYGFTDAVTVQIIAGLKNQSGKIFHSLSHTVLNNRAYLLLEKQIQEISSSENTADFESSFKVQYPASLLKTYPSDDKIAYFDASFASMPLEMRNWQEGDFFYPLGMKHKKKLSDFFTDNKVALTEKRRIPIVLHKGEIIWIVGYRIDERFKVTTKTSKILKLTYLGKLSPPI